MTFVFKIDDVAENHGDPGGHYHHWTVLIGTLVEGTMHRGDYVSIPCLDGTMTAAVILRFEAFHLTIGEQISAGEISQPLGVVAWAPAPNEKQVRRDIATSCTFEKYRTIILSVLQRDPMSIFHCFDCEKALHKIPEALLYLRQIVATNPPESDIVRRANAWLQPRPLPSTKEEPRTDRPWWAFWRKD
jgi:hypothetical protein